MEPRVSIGLPVYNGEVFLAETLNSILSQTFQDFELIICDNASTDQTQEICRKFARQDERIRYYRNEANLGAAKNFNRVFSLARGSILNGRLMTIFVRRNFWPGALKFWTTIRRWFCVTRGWGRSIERGSLYPTARFHCVRCPSRRKIDFMIFCRPICAMRFLD